MFYKGMVLEIKEDYCLAMADDGQVLRIKKKGEMREGDCIYILNEDLYSEEPKGQSERLRVSRISKRTMNSIIAVAAAVMLCLSALILPKITDKAYAVVSIDSSASLQVELDENYNVQRAISYEASVPKEQLKQMEGQSLEEAAAELRTGDSEAGNTILIGYALEKGDDSQQERKLKEYLQKLFNTEAALYLKGSRQDIKQAKLDKQTLGLYIAQKAITEDQIEAAVEDLSREAAIEMLRNQPGLMRNATYRKALEDDEKKAKKTKERKAEDDASADDDDDDEDDDGDDKDKSKMTSPGSKNDKSKKPSVQPKPDDDADSDDDETELDDEEDDD